VPVPKGWPLLHYNTKTSTQWKPVVRPSAPYHPHHGYNDAFSSWVCIPCANKLQFVLVLGSHTLVVIPYGFLICCKETLPHVTNILAILDLIPIKRWYAEIKQPSAPDFSRITGRGDKKGQSKQTLKNMNRALCVQRIGGKFFFCCFSVCV
jgi:hypothetical protein